MAAVTSVSFSAMTQSTVERKSSGVRAVEGFKLRSNFSFDSLNVRSSNSSSSRFVLHCMSTDLPTVADTKMNFLKAYKRPIPTVYNTVLQELIVQQHLIKYKKSYRYDPVFALGFVTVYDQLMEGYPSEEDHDAIFKAYIEALNEDPQKYRADAQKLEEWARTQNASTLVDFSSRDGEVESVLKDIAQRAGTKDSFCYSRLFAVGLFRLLELANVTDPTILEKEALKSCLLVNAPLLYRAASRVPFTVLKYVMTLDGKIAASTGHASWISSKLSRTRVFEMRGRSDAVIVGGNTVRRDNPRLTARHGGGHVPRSIVLSQSLDLPEEAHLWNVSEVPTIVATQRGARRSFQRLLASKGVEVVEFDILDPRDVMGYLYDRGYLSILWECGGTLAASAISSGVIHKVHAFVAPKIIGGKNAPSPVGELGMVEMTQALELIDVHYEQIGPDILVSGFLQPVPDLTPAIPSVEETSAIDPTISPYESSIIFFYKTWDPYGAFSNFSLHPIQMPDENGELVTWSSVEHYYQAQKFVGESDPVAKSCIEEIKCAKSPEEAARIGRRIQRQQTNLARSDWESVKIDVMYKALKCKFTTYPYLNSLLLSTAGSVLVEGSPHDLFWGGGRDGEGLNYLGRLLMKLRSEFLGDSSESQNYMLHQTSENK